MNRFNMFTLFLLLTVSLVIGEENGTEKPQNEDQIIEQDDQMSKHMLPKPIGVVYLLRLTSDSKNQSAEPPNEISDEETNFKIELSPLLLVLAPETSPIKEDLDTSPHSRKKRTLKSKKGYGYGGGGGCTTCGCNTCGGGGGTSGSWSSSSSSSGSWGSS